MGLWKTHFSPLGLNAQERMPKTWIIYTPSPVHFPKKDSNQQKTGYCLPSTNYIDIIVSHITNYISCPNYNNCMCQLFLNFLAI